MPLFKFYRIHFSIRSEKRYDEYDAFAYLRPFATDLWSAIIAWITVSGTILLVIEAMIKKPFHKLKILNGYVRSVEYFVNQGFYLLNFERKNFLLNFLNNAVLSFHFRGSNTFSKSFVQNSSFINQVRSCLGVSKLFSTNFILHFEF